MVYRLTIYVMNTQEIMLDKNVKSFLSESEMKLINKDLVFEGHYYFSDEGNVYCYTTDRGYDEIWFNISEKETEDGSEIKISVGWVFGSVCKISYPNFFLQDLDDEIRPKLIGVIKNQFNFVKTLLGI